MKIVAVLAVLAMAASGQAICQESIVQDVPEHLPDSPAAPVSPSPASKEDAQKAAAAAFEAYISGGPAAMLKAEERCWTGLKSRAFAAESVAARCSLMGMAGAFIENAYARQQRRSPAPAYTGQGVRDRSMAKTRSVGWTEARTQAMLTEAVAPNIDAILAGLMNAGMR